MQLISERLPFKDEKENIRLFDAYTSGIETVKSHMLDPDNPFNYAELRGSLKEVVEDPTGSFWVHLAERYGNPGAPAPDDSPDRVILVMQIDRILGFTG